MRMSSLQRSHYSPSLALRQSFVAVVIQACFSVVLPSPAHALPDGPVVVAGQATIGQPAPGQMNVTASHGTIINWQGFSIGASEITRFIQPSANSAVLNRVVGGDISQLLGQLQANGRVFLINPNGIVIGNGARIDTNGFLASTLDIANSDFLAGRLRFSGTGESGSIVNRGTIVTGAGGQVILLAPNIENNGLIETPGGELLLAAGRKIELASPHLDGVSFEVQAPTDSVLNLGRLLADNGAIGVFAGTLKNAGEIRANRITQGADGSVYLSASSELELQAGSDVRSDGFAGGTIRIDSAAGTARITGTVSARGEVDKGGDILVTGDRIALESASLLDASGATGGGQIRIGGDYQGNNPGIANAQRVFVDATASLAADAGQQGDGGRIIIWSDDLTRYYGTLSAQGGRLGGNGGFAEVSGKRNLEFFGAANLGAPRGNRGTLLLDPLDITVANGGGLLTSVVDQFADFPDNLITISPTALNAVSGNVTLQANRHIYFNDAVALTAGGAGLTAQAGGAGMTGGNVYLNQGITTTGGAVSLSGNTISGTGTISTQGGSVALTTASSLTGYTGAITTSGGSATLSAGGSIYYTSINAGSGNIALSAASGSLYNNTLTGGTLTLNASSSISGTVNAANRIDATSTGSSIQLNNASGQALRIGTLQAASDVYLYGYAGIQQATGGGTTAPRVRVYANNSASTMGSASAPLILATPQLYLNNLGAAAYVSLSGSPTLTALTMSGTLSALVGSSLTGAANLSTFSLASVGGVLQANVASTGGFGSGFNLNVSDAGMNVPSMVMPGASVTLTAAGAMNVGTISSGSISLTAGSCSSFNTTCANSSPITASSLTTSGTGSINVSTSDNGNIDIGTLAAGGSASITAANYSYWSAYPRTSAINVGTATTGYGLTAQNYGTGAITFTGAVNTGQNIVLNARHGDIALQAAASSTNYGVSATATGNIAFQSITANGSSGSVSLTSTGGSIETTTDNAGADITAATNVTLTASHASNGHIGNSTFTNPLDIVAGTSTTVSLTAGTYVGAAGKPVTVDYSGTPTSTLKVNAGQQFHVTTPDTLSGIELTASAAGVGAGGTATLDSADLDITASSDGTTLTIGSIAPTNQATNPLNKFAFTASGASNLIFGNINLATTSGYNELALTAGGALTQSTGNIVSGHTTLAAGSGQAVSLNDITVAAAAGNALSINGGSITTGNLLAPSLNLNGSSLSLGSVTTSGTYQSSWVYVPRLGYSTYVTDQLQLSASGGSLTSGAIASATSATLAAASFSTGNLTAATNLGLTATGSYTSGAIAISAPTTSIIAPGGIDTTAATLTATNATLRATGGNVLTNLTGTTSLTLETGSLFTIASTGTLTNLNITSAGLAASGSSLSANSGNQSLALTGTSPQTFNLQSTTGLTTVYQETSAITDVDLTANLAGTSSFTYSAPGANVTATSVTLGTGNVSLTTGSTGNLTLTSVSTGSGSVTANSSGGNIALASVSTGGGTLSASASSGSIAVTSVNTGGGTLNASTSSGNIAVTSVTTAGGNVGLTASSGSITSAGSSINAAGAVTLSAAAGSIGAAGNTLNLASATTLNLTAHDTIDVTASGTLTNLAVNTFASGSGAISIVSPNHGGLSIARSGGELVLGALAPTTAGSFTLVARDGNLRVNGDLGNLTGLTLNAGSGYNSTADLVIAASGGARTIANSGNLDFRAGRDITLSAGSATGESISVVTGGTQYFSAGGDFLLSAGSGGNSFALAQAGSSQTLYANHFSVLGGGTGAYAEMTGNSQSFTGIHGNATIRGGAGTGAYAKVASSGSQNFGSQYTYGNDPTDNITVEGGTGGGAYASLSATSTQAIYGGGDISVLGGAGSGAYAEIIGGGSQTIGSTYSYYNDPTANILVQGGNASNASARISAQSTQSIQAGGNITVAGGNATDAFADIISYLGTQTVGYNASSAYYDPTDAITLTAGNATGAHAEVNALDNNQSVYATQNITLTGGSGDDAYAVMNGTNQTVSSLASLVLTGGTAVTAGLNTTKLYAVGDQTITATGGITLAGSGSGAAVKIESDNNQSITAGGALTIGTTASLGESSIYAGGSQTAVIGSLLVQGGAAVTATAKLHALGSKTISTLGGGIQVLGGSAGSAQIDPPDLNMVANGPVVVQAGAGPSAFALITGGNINLAATNGNVSVLGGGAGANITATGTPGSVNIFGSGNLVIDPGAGGASITALGTSTIDILGNCSGCTSGLVGPFTLTVGSQASPGSTASSSWIDGLLSLLDYSSEQGDLHELYFIYDEDGNPIAIARRRLQQCG